MKTTTNPSSGRPRTSEAAFAILAVLAVGGPALAQDRPDEDVASDSEEAVGAVDFRVSCDAAVREDFDRALALMHHMMYAQARGAFEEIAEAAPDCGMAHWGVATTLFQPLWPTRPSDDDLRRGRERIRKAQELGSPDERERRLVDATAAFFREGDDVSYWDRVRRWAEGMAEAHEAAPDDLDTAALYALSRLAIAQRAGDRDPLHDEAERILREVWEQESTHPGAIHYTIHSTDADGRAENALDIVGIYGEVAPEVPHALHMPSHIYVRLGDWPKVIDWNVRSARAALAKPVEGAVSHHYLHAMDYLLYAYLQQGEDGEARRVLDEAMAKDRHQPTFISAFHAAAMPARFAVERRRWDDAASLEPRSPDYLPWDAATWPEGMTWYARGLGAVHEGDRALASRAEERLRELREAAREAGEEGLATYIEVDRRILAGRLAHAQDEDAEAERLMRSAAELEASIEKHPVSPGALMPPNEALGDLLADLGRFDDALAAYRASDEIWPGRYNTLLGAARAAVAAGDEEAAREHYEELLESAGDSPRPGIDEARGYLEN